MDYESQLKVQAYLDGELPEVEARAVVARLAADPEAQGLSAELRNTREALAGFETGVRHPESREFFWSKIQREIQRQNAPAPAPAPRPIPWFARLQRFLVPASGFAVVALVLTLTLGRGDARSTPGELELVSDEMGAVTFRSQSERMTMVWLYKRDTAPDAFTDPGEVE